MNDLPPRMPPMATVQDYLLAAASELLRAVDEAHDSKEPPLKYATPYGAVNTLRRAVAMVKEAPKTVPVQEPILILNGYQLRDALEFVAPDGDAEQLETEVAIQYGREGHSGPGHYCSIAEYPEEGAILLPESPLTKETKHGD